MRQKVTSRKQLADLEELVHAISNPQEKILMAEAVDCYHMGAYRAAIIVTWVAAADVLMNRLKEIASNDGIAKKRLNIVSELRAQGRAVEKELIQAFSPGAETLGSLNDFEVRSLNGLKHNGFHNRP